MKRLFGLLFSTSVLFGCQTGGVDVYVRDASGKNLIESGNLNHCFRESNPFWYWSYGDSGVAPIQSGVSDIGVRAGGEEVFIEAVDIEGYAPIISSFRMPWFIKPGEEIKGWHRGKTKNEPSEEVSGSKSLEFRVVVRSVSE